MREPQYHQTIKASTCAEDEQANSSTEIRNQLYQLHLSGRIPATGQWCLERS